MTPFPGLVITYSNIAAPYPQHNDPILDSEMKIKII